MMAKTFDAFISHASEDKRYFIKPLANSLTKYGGNIWYDEFTLKPGMSLSRSIERGLSNSNFGIVVLSKSFFKKRWTEYELRALNSFEIDNPGVIIPIWYKVNLEEVRNFSPYLSDKLAIVYDGKITIDDIAIQILEVIREDLFEKVHLRKAWVNAIKSSEIKEQKISELKIGPVRHKEFSQELITRIRLVRATLLDVYPHSMEFWLGGFQRDLHPEDEILIWERIATVYLESINLFSISTSQKKEDLFNIIFNLMMGEEIKNIKTNNFNLEELYNIVRLYRLLLPYPDIKEDTFENQIKAKLAK